MPSAARVVATQVLYRVAVDEAWASVVLDNEIRERQLDARDASLATHIVYGALRVLPALDEAANPFVKTPKKVEPFARAALRAAQYQLAHLGRVPTHAVVDDAVSIVRAERGQRVAGFVNAVLRKLAGARPAEPIPPTMTVVQPWLREALTLSLGKTRPKQLLNIADGPPPTDLYVRQGANRDAVVESLRGALPDAEVTLTRLAPRGVRVRGGGDARSWPGFAAGAFFVQDEGSQLIAELVGAEPGERILDACAGRGGKTVRLVEGVTGAGKGAGADTGTDADTDTDPHIGTVVAVDLHEHRLLQIPGTLDRLGLPAGVLELAPVDLTQGAGGYTRSFDRVLVDAPCTGVGTLRRRPELLLRLSRKNPAQMADRQVAILQRAATLVRLGGVLVYAVCSPLNEEGEAVAKRFDSGDFCPYGLNGFPNKNGRLSSSHGVLLGPWLEGADPFADAYQVYRWVRVG